MKLPWNKFSGYPKSLNTPPADGRDFLTTLPQDVLELVYEAAFESTWGRGGPKGPPCRALEDLHRRHLFRDVHLQNYRQPDRLLKILQANKALTDLVRSFASELQGHFPEDETEEEWEQIETAMMRTAATMKLLFGLLHKVRTVEIREEIYIRSFLKAKPTMPDLVTLTVSGGFHRKDAFNPSHWTALDSLPSLQEFRIQVFGSDYAPPTFAFKQPTIPSFISRLTTLELGGYLGDSPHLPHFFAALTSSLTSLKLATDSYASYDPLSSHLNRIPFPSAVLSLSLFSPGGYDGDKTQDPALPDALKRFTALQHLTLMSAATSFDRDLYSTLAALPLRTLRFERSARVTHPGLISLLRTSSTLRILHLDLDAYSTLSSWDLRRFSQLSPEMSSTAPNDDLRPLAFPSTDLFGNARWTLDELLDLIKVGKEVGVCVVGGAAEQLQQEGFYEARIKLAREKLAEEEEKAWVTEEEDVEEEGA